MRMKKAWILISWLHKKPADQDLHFQKKEYNFEIKLLKCIVCLLGQIRIG